MYLDDFKPIVSKSGYQEIGYCGKTGFDGSWISIKDQYYSRSFSAHPPSELVFDLNGGWESLICEVGINDTCVSERFSEFFVYADDLLVAHIPHLTQIDNKRSIICNINGAKKLTLKSLGNAHSIWIDPKLSKEKISKFQGCFSNLWINSTQMDTSQKITVMTTITPNFLKLFKSMIDSLRKVANFNSFQVVALSFDSTPEVEKFCIDNNVIEIKCEDKNKKTAIGKKLITHSIARVCNSEYFIFLDCDMLFKVDIIAELLNTLEALDNSVFLTTKENGMRSYIKLHEAAEWIYDSSKEELMQLGLTSDEINSKIIINTGVYGGSRQAFFAMEDTIKRMFPKAEIWESHKVNSIREQILTNIATIKLANTAFIKESYNVQLHPYLDRVKNLDDVNALPAKVLHFNGNSRALLDGFMAKSLIGFKPIIDPKTYIQTMGRVYATDTSPSTAVINLFVSLLEINNSKTVLEITPGNAVLCLNAALNSRKVYSVINGMNKDIKDIYDNAPESLQRNIIPVYLDHLDLCSFFTFKKPYIVEGDKYDVCISDVILMDFNAMFSNPLFASTAGKQIDKMLSILLPSLRKGQTLMIYGTDQFLRGIEINKQTHSFDICSVADKNKSTFGMIKMKIV